MRGWVLKGRQWTSSSKRSTRLRAAVWGSAYPSVAPLSRVIMAVSGQYPMMVRERRFHFPFPAATRLRRATLVTAPFGRLMGNRWTTNENFGMGQFFLLNV